MILSKKLEHITFDYTYNDDRLYWIPETVTHVVFGASFNQSVEQLPKTITHIKFGTKFNQEIDELSDNITHLIFGSCFNRSVDHLPRKLLYLKVGIAFNKSISKLPNSLKSLILGCEFNKNIDNLPLDLEYLEFYWNSRSCILSRKLKWLVMRFSYSCVLEYFVKTVKRLELYGSKISLNQKLAQQFISSDLEELIVSESIAYSNLEFLESISHKIKVLVTHN